MSNPTGDALTHTIGDGPVERRFKHTMNALAHVIDDTLNGFPSVSDPRNVVERKVGFVLLVFPFGEEIKGRCNYMSSADRDDVVKLLKEQLAYFESDEGKKK